MTWTQAPLYVSGMLCMFVFLAVWLGTKKGWRTVGSPILVILMTAVAANTGLIPTATQGHSVYASVFVYLAPMGIFIALLEVDLRSLKHAGAPILQMFCIGATGTLIGVFVAWNLVQPAVLIGPLAHAVAGMYTGTYIGGSINFNAIALNYQVNEHADLFAATTVVDNLIGTPWIIATLILPKYLQKIYPRKKRLPDPSFAKAMKSNEPINIQSLVGIFGLALLAMAFSKLLSTWLPSIPEILTLTTIALILAQIPVVKHLKGAHTLGFFIILIFLATVGTLCDLKTITSLGEVAGTLIWFVVIMVLVHGFVIFGIGALLRMDWDIIAVASQANVGGNTTALAAAESLERPDLLIPGVLVGSLGNALGTYAGFMVAGMLG
ncbi:DUF819 family protein [Algoriphagus halophytocola]|uniref:DUF819 family protein n=1 Tax=Algoriphagus halophytocola TaxID=2991499 RepID=UPI0022DD11D6|nr:DUF819 family protein [Algoriphagus sp. TR-M9]WBL41628.1 DUF819 family protein [Algoriphagus sp. TR-M9]